MSDEEIADLITWLLGLVALVILYHFLTQGTTP